mmetsp:Transcript_39263/g.98220  ORF Transcript_39263/g.98220 Transcript_39263/m.98220 type:complete len:286 (-) Transcript_39263:168-1025(-)
MTGTTQPDRTGSYKTHHITTAAEGSRLLSLSIWPSLAIESATYKHTYTVSAPTHENRTLPLAFPIPPYSASEWLVYCDLYGPSSSWVLCSAAHPPLSCLGRDPVFEVVNVDNTVLGDVHIGHELVGIAVGHHGELLLVHQALDAIQRYVLAATAVQILHGVFVELQLYVDAVESAEVELEALHVYRKHGVHKLAKIDQIVSVPIVVFDEMRLFDSEGGELLQVRLADVAVVIGVELIKCIAPRRQLVISVFAEVCELLLPRLSLRVVIPGQLLVRPVVVCAMGVW